MSSVNPKLSKIEKISNTYRSITEKLNDIPTQLTDCLPQFKGVSIHLNDLSLVAEKKLNELGSFLSKRRQSKVSPIVIGQNKGKKGEVIFDDFVDLQGQAICREVAIRAKTVNIYKAQLKSELDYLLELDNNIKSDPKVTIMGQSQDYLQKRIEEISQKLEMCANFTSDWASTNTPRLLFEKLGEKIAREIGIPVIGNLRVHRVDFKDEGEGISINRSAAISDFAHAETNLQEIKDFKFLCSLVASLRWNENLPKATVDYYKNYYYIDITDFKQFLNLIKNLQDNILHAYGHVKVSKINEIENERRDLLQRQVLQDLVVHFLNKPVDTPIVFYTRVAFLDPTKKPEINTTTGYHLSERNEILDMKAIYEELDGAEILFDLENTEGPFFDLEDRIHMPKLCCSDSIADNYLSVKLNTLLFNSSVQNNRKNEGIQLALNRESFYKAELMGFEGKVHMLMDNARDQLLNCSKTSFNSAHKLVTLAKELGYCSVDCYGGKDRTGYAMALEIYYAIRKKIRMKAKIDIQIKEDYSEIMALVREKLLSTSGVAVGIVSDNTAYMVMKLSGFMLKLYVSGKGVHLLKGIGKRLSEYLQSAAVFLPISLVTPPSRHDESILYDQASEIAGIKNELKKVA